jgi:hypothetical protein
MNWTVNREQIRRYQAKYDASFQTALQTGAVNWPPVLAILTDLVLWVAIGSAVVAMATKLR